MSGPRQRADDEHDPAARCGARRPPGCPASIARSTAAATASGSPAKGGTGSPAVISVRTNPGFTQTTRTPRSA